MRGSDPRERDERHPGLEQDIADDDMLALEMAGKFRAVDGRDLPPEADLARLEEEGLIQRKTAVLRGSRERVDVYALTPEGRDLLENQQDDSDAQRYWAGIVKPAELEHDLELARAYRDAASDIEKAGGHVVRVVLDYEMKSQINAEMNRPGDEERDVRRSRLAEEHDLPVVDDHLMLPDMRIEYQDKDGKEEHMDVEVVTRHYKGAHMAAKRQSGFRLVRSQNGPRTAPRDDHHLSWI